jgi:hypothetical protein
VGKFLLVVIVFAAAVYSFFWLIERRRAGAPKSTRLPSPPAPRSVAPDDDEGFLRELDRRRHTNPDNPNRRDPGPAGPTDTPSP